MVDFNRGLELEESVKVGDIMNGGTVFEIKSDFSDAYENSELFVMDRAINEEFDNYEKEKYKNPWECSFAEVKESMVKISDDVYKKLKNPGNPDKPMPERARVTFHFNGYYEGKTDGPYDSSYLRGQPFTHILPDGVLPGLYESMRTMNEGELSWFWISHRKMFMELGCMPRVPPKADLIFEIKVISIIEIGADDALDALEETEYNTKFEEIKEKVQDVMKNAAACFKTLKYAQAITNYLKAVQALETCNLKNENEEKEQQELLIQLYRNLAICYNKRNLPKKACEMVNQLKRLTKIENDVKIMFSHGKALMALGDFPRARNSLCVALRLEPKNPEIIKELENLEAKAKKYYDSEKKIAKNIFKAVNEIDELEKQKQTEPEVDEDELKRRESIKKELMRFKESKSNKLPLPDTFSLKEIEMIEDLTEELGMKLNTNFGENFKTLFITKE